MITIKISKNKRLRFLILSMVTILLLTAGIVSVSIANAKVKICPGTYLVDLGQSAALWTLSEDGNFQGSDSAEIFLGFSHAQGAWEQTGVRTASATWLDISFDANAGTPAGYARVDADLVFSSDCETLSGTLDLRIYAPTEDPLDTTGTSPVIIDLPFTGRRINP
jgi:hypothetical protein